MLEGKLEVGNVTKTKGSECFRKEEVINCVTAESLNKMETENYLLNLAIRRSLGTLIRALLVQW